MRGAVLSFFGVFCTSFFSVCLFLSDNLLVFWLFLELGVLSLIPCFFLYSESGVLGGLFSYIVVSGVSSSLIVSGFLEEGIFLLSVLGLLMKFGVFPFLGWVYVVVSSSNWLVVWALSTVLKSGFLFFSFFVSGAWDILIVEVACFFTFVFVSLLVWVYTPSWLVYWCHVLVCSSASLVVMAVEVSPDVLIGLFLVYALWASFVVRLLSAFDGLEVSGGGSCFLFVVLLVSFPGSVSLFYKLLIGASIYSCGMVVFLGWVVYNVSEQFFLVKYLISSSVPRGQWSGGTLV